MESFNYVKEARSINNKEAWNKSKEIVETRRLVKELILNETDFCYIQKIDLKEFGLFLVHEDKMNKFENELEHTEKYPKRTFLFQVWSKRINKTNECRIMKHFILEEHVDYVIY